MISLTIEELRKDCERIATRARQLTKLNDQMKHRMRVTFWSFYESIPESLKTTAPQQAMEEYHTKMSEWLLQTEQDIIRNLDENLWSSDERLCCVCAAMSLKERADKLREPAAELQPDGLTISWVDIQLKASYTASGIIHANQVICLLEDDWQDVRGVFHGLRMRIPEAAKTDQELLTLAADTSYRVRVTRLIDGIDQFLNCDTHWSLFQ